MKKINFNSILYLCNPATVKGSAVKLSFVTVSASSLFPEVLHILKTSTVAEYNNLIIRGTWIYNKPILYDL